MKEGNYKTLDITPDPSFLEVLKYQDLDEANCVAELIDNSLDNFKDSNLKRCQINIELDKNRLVITDNGTGMNWEQLENSLKAGYSTKNKINNLGLYGVGFNIATIKLGDKTTIITKTKEASKWIKTTIDINELKKGNSFKTPSTLVDYQSDYDSGTIIEIDLRDEYQGFLSRPKSIENIRKTLGKVYTFLLRDHVPGLSGPVSGGKRDFTINVNGLEVFPVLPCIWDEKRRLANDCLAVKYIEHELQPEKVILKNGESEIREKRIWGWIGISRCLETHDYGISLIRNGRIIEDNDKGFFQFVDPETNKPETEYPIEQITKGRIVGEIHCDHLEPEYTKQRFNKNDDYRVVHQVVRGKTWLRPTYARQHINMINESPLAEIYSAVRRNDPGTKYLTPGNGKKGIHVEAKNWVKKFHEGEDEYFTDEKWWQACLEHEKIANSDLDLGPDTGTDIVGPTPTGESTSGVTVKPKKDKTLKERASEWRAGGGLRLDLSKTIYLEKFKLNFSVEVIETVSRIQVYEDDTPRACHVIPGAGSKYEIYINKKHDLFEKWGRSTTDLALFNMVSAISSKLQGQGTTFSEIFFDLISHFPDQEVSENTTKSIVSDLKKKICTEISKILRNDPNKYWDVLDDKRRDTISLRASESDGLDSNDLNTGAYYSNYLQWVDLKVIIEKYPEDFLNGRLFSYSLGGSNSVSARERILNYLLTTINDLSVFELVGEGLLNVEIKRAILAAEDLSSALADVN